MLLFSMIFYLFLLFNSDHFIHVCDILALEKQKGPAKGKQFK